MPKFDDILDEVGSKKRFADILDPLRPDPNSEFVGAPPVADPTKAPVYVMPEVTSTAPMPEKIDMADPKGRLAVIQAYATRLAQGEIKQTSTQENAPEFESRRLAVSKPEELYARPIKDVLSGATSTMSGIARDQAETWDSDTMRGVTGKLEEWDKELAAKNPNFLDNLFSGAGSMLVFLPAGYGAGMGAKLAVQGAGKLVGLFANISPKVISGIASGVGATVSGTLESSAEAGNSWQQVYGETKSKEKADAAAEKVFYLNLVVNPALNKLGIFGERAAGISKAFLSATPEAIQEWWQQLAQNYAAGKPLTEGAWESAAIGGILGFGGGAITPSFEGANKGERATAAPAPPSDIQPKKYDLAPTSAEPVEQMSIAQQQRGLTEKGEIDRNTPIRQFLGENKGKEKAVVPETKTEPMAEDDVIPALQGIKTASGLRAYPDDVIVRMTTAQRRAIAEASAGADATVQKFPAKEARPEEVTQPPVDQVKPAEPEAIDKPPVAPPAELAPTALERAKPPVEGTPGAKLFVEFGGKKFGVASLKDASEKFQKARDLSGKGAEDLYGAGVAGMNVTDEQGKAVAHISYNGRVWEGPSTEDEAKKKLLYDPRKVSATAKEPAQKDELDIMAQRSGIPDEEIRQYHETEAKLQKSLDEGALNYLKLNPKEAREVIARREGPEALAKYEKMLEAEKPTQPTEAPNGEALPGRKEEVAKPTKQPWEMTREEYFAEGKLRFELKKKGVISETPDATQYTTSVHRAGVQQALSEGKPVPEEVLKEYPDLVKKGPQFVSELTFGDRFRFKEGGPVNTLASKEGKGRLRVRDERGRESTVPANTAIFEKVVGSEAKPEAPKPVTQENLQALKAEAVSPKELKEQKKTLVDELTRAQKLVAKDLEELPRGDEKKQNAIYSKLADKLEGEGFTIDRREGKEPRVVVAIPNDGTFYTPVNMIEAHLERARQFVVSGVPSGKPPEPPSGVSKYKPSPSTTKVMEGEGWYGSGQYMKRGERPKGLKIDEAKNPVGKEQVKKIEGWGKEATEPATMLGYVHSDVDTGTESVSLNPIAETEAPSLVVFKVGDKYFVYTQENFHRAIEGVENPTYSVSPLKGNLAVRSGKRLEAIVSSYLPGRSANKGVSRAYTLDELKTALFSDVEKLEPSSPRAFGKPQTEPPIASAPAKKEKTAEPESVQQGEEGKEVTEFMRESGREERNLLVQHNLTEAKLREADRLGGMPMPSLAIARKEHPLGNFGEITLIAPKETVDPRGSRRNRIYAADRYTARMPEARYRVESEKVKSLVETMRLGFDRVFGEEAIPEYRRGHLFADSYYLSLKDEIFQNGRRAIADSDLFSGYLADREIRAGNLTLEDARKTGLSSLVSSTGPITYEQRDEAAGELLESLDPRRVMWAGTTSEGRQRYKEYSIANALRAMRKEMRESGGESFFYGAGSVRAQATPPMRNLSQVKANRNKIVSPEAMKAVKERYEQEFGRLSNELVRTYKHGQEAYRLGSSGEALGDAARTPWKLKEVLEEWQFQPTDRFVERFKGFLARFVEAPSEYFEAKPDRIVSLDEFVAAVVPKGTSEQTLAILKKHGINDITEYATGDEKARADAVRSVTERRDNLLFMPEFKDEKGLRSPVLRTETRPGEAGEARTVSEDENKVIHSVNTALFAGEEGGVEVDPSPEVWSRESVQIANEIALAFTGNPLVPFKGSGKIGGFYNRTASGNSTIGLRSDTKNPPLAVVVHEALHHIQYTAPELYERLASRFVRELRSFDEVRDYYAKKGFTAASDKKLLVEAVNDFFAQHALDPEFWNRLAYHDAPLAQRLLNTIRRFLRSLLNMTGNKFDRNIAQFVEDADALLEEGASVISEYLNQRGVVVKAGKVGPVFMPKAEREKWYYSQMRVELSKLPNSGPVEQMKATLDSWVKQGKFKAEEYEWSGLPEFLSEKQGKVTKEELLRAFDENSVVVEEVLHSDKSQPLRAGEAERFEEIKKELNTLGFRVEYEPNVLTGEGEPHVYDKNGEEVEQDHLTRYVRGTVGTPEYRTLRDFFNFVATVDRNDSRYEQYVLPGGKNYRELLLTLPSPRNQDQIDRINAITLEKAELAEDRDPVTNAMRNEKRWHELSAEQERLARKDDDAIRREFRSSHWDTPNVLAHIRFNERTDAQGRRVLFVEEIQSDLHQKGRKVGYGLIAAERAEKAELNQLGDKRTVEQEARYQEFQRRGMENPPPNSPFKKTWHELAFKRAVRYAAENGFDAVAWTTGEQQAERYDLSKQVKHIAWEKNDDGTYNLNAPLPDGQPGIYKEDLSVETVRELVGKEITDKILAGEGREDKESPYRGWRILEGENLKVGGTGMTGFYDKILVDYANKFGKKWGAGVEDATINLTAMPSSEYEKYPAGHPYVEKNRPTVHSLPLTPEMKESALDVGFNLFMPELQHSERVGSNIMHAIRGERFELKDGLSGWAGEKAYSGITNTKQFHRMMGLPSYVGWRVPALRKVFDAMRGMFFEGNERFSEVEEILLKARDMKLSAEESEKVAKALWTGNDQTERKYYSDQVLAERFKLSEREIENYQLIVAAQKKATRIKIDAAKFYLLESGYAPEEKEVVDAPSAETWDAIKAALSKDRFETFADVRAKLIAFEGDRNKIDPDDLAEFDAVRQTDEVREAYAEQRAVKEVARLGGYISNRRHGDYYVRWTENGEIHYNQYELQSEAREAAKAMRQDRLVQNITEGKVNKQFLSDLAGGNVSLGELLDLVEQLGIGENSEVQKLLDEYKKKGFAAYTIRRKYVPGYDRTYENAIRSVHDFARGAGSNYARTKGRLMAQKELKGIDSHRYGHDKELAQMYLNAYDRSNEGHASLLRKALYFGALAWSPTFVIQQVLQPYQTHLPNLALQVGPRAIKVLEEADFLATSFLAHGLGDKGKGVVEWAGKRLGKSVKFDPKTPFGFDPELLAGLARARKRGSIVGSMTEELAGSVRLGGHLSAPTLSALAVNVGMNKESVEKTTGQIEALSQFAGSYTEKKNRIQGFIEGWILGKEKGLKGNDLYEYAETWTETVNIPYGKQNLPIALMRLQNATHAIPVLRDIPRLAFSFMSYQLALTHMIANSIRGDMPVSKKATAMLYGSLSMTLQAGLVGLPFMGLLKLLWGLLTDDDDPATALAKNKDIPETVRTIFKGGIPALLGVDLRRSLGAGDMNPYDVSRLAPVTLVKRGAKVYQDVKRGEWGTAVKDMPIGIPPLVRAQFKASDAEEYGIRSGARTLIPKKELSAGEILRMRMGLTPFRSAEKVDEQFALTKKLSERGTDFDRLADALANAIYADDAEARKKAIEAVQEYNKNQTPALRITGKSLTAAVKRRLAEYRAGVEGTESARKKALRRDMRE